MKKWGILLAGLLWLGTGQTAGTDVAKLRPVEVVLVRRWEGQVIIQTDTNDCGVGPDLSAAVEDLHRTTPAEIFLETADYLLIGDDAEPLLGELMAYLRPACQVCTVASPAELEGVAQFLQQHPPLVTLIRYRSGERSLPVLKIGERSMELVR